MTEVFETDDLALAEDMLTGAYSSTRIGARGPQRGLRMMQTTAGAVRFDHDVYSMNLDLCGSPLGALIFGHLNSGRLSLASGGSERRVPPGSNFLIAQPEHSYIAEIDDGDFELAILPADLPSRVAATEPGRSPQPVRFTGYEPVSRRAARSWEETYAYIRDTIFANPGASAQPLVAASAARLLAAVTLAAYPNTTQADPSVGDRHDAHPATVRRAIAFIDNQAHLPITIADIAAAANVSARAVQLAFRRHLDITPMGYLRNVRLACARADLLAADPGQVTVTEVAYRWGFPSSSRFGRYYRQAYGSTPVQALHEE